MLLFSCIFALIESINCPTEFSTLILFFNTSFFILFIILSSSLCNAFVTVLIAVSALLAFVNQAMVVISGIKEAKQEAQTEKNKKKTKGKENI